MLCLACLIGSTLMCPLETHASMQCSWKSKSLWYGQAQHSGLLYHCWDSLHPHLIPPTELVCLVYAVWLCTFVSLSKCPNVSPKCVHALPFQLQGKRLRKEQIRVLLPLLLLLLIILCSLFLCYSATMSWLPIKASSPWRKQLFPFYFWLHDWTFYKVLNAHMPESPHRLAWCSAYIKDSRDDWHKIINISKKKAINIKNTHNTSSTCCWN